MQTVFRLVPHHALRAINDAGGDFLPRWAGRQCMNTAEVSASAIISSSTHQSANAFSASVWPQAHAGPYVGGNEVRTARRFKRVGEYLPLSPAALSIASGDGVARRR